ncbi:hypothetical protein ILYODFUR_008106 [Ilyodon furcidens]|uniref:Uncharacterized protein n=1 Tax=Ilyodon furcidens TaxID=33524 RepID=A0ABV0TGW8_9TELE
MFGLCPTEQNQIQLGSVRSSAVSMFLAVIQQIKRLHFMCPQSQSDKSKSTELDFILLVLWLLLLLILFWDESIFTLRSSLVHEEQHALQLFAGLSNISCSRLVLLLS